MPKSFGNKSFITPPTAVKLLGDAGDLADLQEATAHMTVMNRMTSGLQQATRRVVLSSGATATLRRAFGHETITLDRSSIFTPEEACIPYMESGRQRWETGTIDISDDLLGICNGPCPGRPLNDGDPSAALAVAGAATLRELSPPSGFTGKLHFMVQALYGSKRTDMQYTGNGEIMVADVLLGHSWEQSTILYTDANGAYWLLQLGGMETATIQKWAPCSEMFDASTPVSEAYRLSLCRPFRGEVALSCTGTQTGIGEPIANGWHSPQAGNEGRIVLNNLIVEDETLYNQTRLCSFALNDNGSIWDGQQTWDDYVSGRFDIVFDVVIESDLFVLSNEFRIWVPDYYEDRQKPAGLVAGAATLVTDAPIYCAYKGNDDLEVYSYSVFSLVSEDQEDGSESYCSLPFGACSSIVNTITLDIGNGFSILGASSPSNEISFIGAGSWTTVDFDGTHDPPEGSGYTDYSWGTHAEQENGVSVNFSHAQAFIVPFGNHESIHLWNLDKKEGEHNGVITTKTDYESFVSSGTCFKGFHTPGGGTTSYQYMQLRLHEFTRICKRYSRFDLGEIYQELSESEGTADLSGGCGSFVEGIEDEPSLDYYQDEMEDYLSPSSTNAPKIVDRESYHFGHDLAWFTGDKSVEAHDGYDSFVDDGCFVGAS